MALADGAEQPGETTLSLAEAVARAVAGNPDLGREQVSVLRARAMATQAEGQLDVILDGRLRLQRDDTPWLCTDRPTGCEDGTAGRTTTTTFELGISRKLESGGSLRLSGQGNFFSSVVPQASPYYDGTYFDSRLALTFTHPLLRGFGAEITLANSRKARIQQDMALLGRQMRACNVVRDVAIAYWELAYATQDFAIKQSAVNLAQEQLRTTRAMIAVGRLAEPDAAAVERAIAQRMEDLATAEQNLIYRGMDLERLFGSPALAATVRLRAADAPTTSDARIDDTAEIDRALAANPQLRALRLGMELSQIDLATARSTLRPRLDVAASVGPVGRRNGLSDTLGRMAGFDNWAGAAALTFELPVQNRTARGQQRAAEEELHLARIDAEDFAMRLRDLVLRTTSNIRTAAQRVRLGQREVEFARQSLDAEKARFGAGRATNNDVLLRQQELKDAESRLLRATVDQNASEAALASVTAEILDRYGVGLKGLESMSRHGDHVLP